MYFTLKDEKAELKAVMFRRDNRLLRFAVEAGMKVLAQGNITVYETRGIYQIVVRQMEPAGLGTLYLAFEALKRKLADEGLFDEERKRPIPRFPSRIGIITSATGAAIQDIKNVLGRRAPHIELFLRPTLVQGADAANDIVAALADFEEFSGVDVVIVGRGGGSLEDLWPFNEEKVARAISDFSIPIVSAVGHDTDFTIVDLAADLRAPTPSAAAEIVSPARNELLAYLGDMDRRFHASVSGRVEMAIQRLDGLTARYGFQQPLMLVEQKRQRVEELWERVMASSPQSILDRGYSVAYKLPERQIVNRVGSLNLGDEFILLMSDGELTAETKEIHKGKKGV